MRDGREREKGRSRGGEWDGVGNGKNGMGGRKRRKGKGWRVEGGGGSEGRTEDHTTSISKPLQALSPPIQYSTHVPAQNSSDKVAYHATDCCLSSVIVEMLSVGGRATRFTNSR